VYALVASPAGHLSDRVSRKGVVLAGWALYAAAYAGFALSRTALHVVLLYLLYGVYHGLVAGAAKAFVADLVPDGLRATAYGGYAAAIGLVTLPASVIGGVLWEGFAGWGGLGPSAPFWFGAGTAALAAVLLATTVSSQASPPAPAGGVT
jgi:MFS family permease